jgi:hypothetical protein
MSFKWITPSDCVRSATTSGVPPAREMRSTMDFSSGTAEPPLDITYRSIASAAPLRICRPSMSTPDIRVCAVNGTKAA